jgi:hypothetical protein
MTNPIENNLARFQAMPLNELDKVKLLKRYDTKFVFHKEKLTPLFDFLCEQYQILEIDQNRSFKYESLYYDTDDYFFYHQHHNKRLNRYKIRCRRYIDSSQCYFEVKFKNNKNRTIKTRLLLDVKNIDNELSEKSKEFGKKSIYKEYEYLIDEIKPKIWIEFDRITLANQLNKERFTFDINLTFTDRKSYRQNLNNLIIAELKSENISLNQNFFQYLKNQKIFPTTFSKYCMGIAMTNNSIKSNRFKKNLIKLRKFS